MRDAIERAARAVGNQTRLAELLGVKKANISYWKRFGLPAERVLAIERATGGKVTRHELRPDLYPAEAA